MNEAVFAGAWISLALPFSPPENSANISHTAINFTVQMIFLLIGDGGHLPITWHLNTSTYRGVNDLNLSVFGLLGGSKALNIDV